MNMGDNFLLKCATDFGDKFGLVKLFVYAFTRLFTIAVFLFGKIR